MMVTTGTTAGRIQKRTCDPMGRWIDAKMVEKNGRVAHVTGAHQVANMSESAAAKSRNTAHSQQMAMLRGQCPNGNANPRHHFSKDLFSLLKQTQDKGKKFTCAGDFNKTTGQGAEGVTRTVKKLGLCDCLCEKLGRDDCSTHARGKRRMDCAIGNLEPECILDATAHAFGDQEGDHRGFNLDLCTQRTFGSLDVPMAPVGSGPFTANNPAKNTAHLQTKHAHFIKAGSRQESQEETSPNGVKRTQKTKRQA